MKKLLVKLIKIGHQSEKKINIQQRRIRDVEWQAISDYIPSKANFLDVGCGTGYSLYKAREEKKCIVIGIDPYPNLAGVNWKSREDEISDNYNIKIVKGVAEMLPFENNTFDVVYSSHVLEHVSDKVKTLKEANRVLKDDGVLIIGMPTSTMAWINLISNFIFTTHERIIKYSLGLINYSNSKKRLYFKHIFFAPSHSEEDKTVLFDIWAYRKNVWKQFLNNEFDITDIIFPALYPYPDYLPLFKLKKAKNFGSSVFFICRKKSIRKLEK